VLLQDIWEPKRAIDLIRERGATFTMASTPFLTDLARTVAEWQGGTQRCDLPVRRRAHPGPLVEQARRRWAPRSCRPGA
jgi:cyclohexanecarboxylate-CoA ligase